MTKAIYRSRITSKKGAYRAREFKSPGNAIAYAKQRANEGGRGYVQRERMVAGMLKVEVIFHTDQHVEVPA